jgi:hypothetical protein
MTERFFVKFSALVHMHAERAHSWDVGLVFEGYTLKFADEVRLIYDAARAWPGHSHAADGDDAIHAQCSVSSAFV